MRFTVYRIPQLAVSAKLLCLLMVVICGAVPSMVKSVRLHNDCSGSELQVDMQGNVYSYYTEDLNQGFSNLTLKSLSFKKLAIFAERSQRYLCFTRGGKLTGSLKFRGRRCAFEETMENGFNRYRSVANRNYSIGFNRRGMPLKGPRTMSVGGRGGKGLEQCTHFVKLGVNLSQNIDNHNRGDHPGQPRIEHFHPFVGQLFPLHHPRGVTPTPDLGGMLLMDIKEKKRKKVPSERVLEIPTSPSLPKHHQRHSKNKQRLRYS